LADDKRTILSHPEHNTEDKTYWTEKFGPKNEIKFCETICPVIKRNGVLNPEKQTTPFVPDLIVNNKLSDLKYQSTPFYSCGHYYGYNPQFTCVFNDKDIVHYGRKYPELDLYFWIDYPESEKYHKNKQIIIHRLEGIFFINFKDLKQLITTKKSPRHSYLRRMTDRNGNAKSSYLIDVRDLECLTILSGSELFT
jgi:hypothetical protein